MSCFGEFGAFSQSKVIFTEQERDLPSLHPTLRFALLVQHRAYAVVGLRRYLEPRFRQVQWACGVRSKSGKQGKSVHFSRVGTPVGGWIGPLCAMSS
jgi:hypothetical protein